MAAWQGVGDGEKQRMSRSDEERVGKRNWMGGKETSKENMRRGNVVVAKTMNT